MVKLAAQLANDVDLFVIFDLQQLRFILFDELSCTRVTQTNFQAHTTIAIWMTDRACVEGINTLLT